jgi:hypothetical protein
MMNFIRAHIQKDARGEHKKVKTTFQQKKARVHMILENS